MSTSLSSDLSPGLKKLRELSSPITHSLSEGVKENTKKKSVTNDSLKSRANYNLKKRKTKKTLQAKITSRTNYKLCMPSTCNKINIENSSSKKKGDKIVNFVSERSDISKQISMPDNVHSFESFHQKNAYDLSTKVTESGLCLDKASNKLNSMIVINPPECNKEICSDSASLSEFSNPNNQSGSLDSSDKLVANDATVLQRSMRNSKLHSSNAIPLSMPGGIENSSNAHLLPLPVAVVLAPKKPLTDGIDERLQKEPCKTYVTILDGIDILPARDNEKNKKSLTPASKNLPLLLPKLSTGNLKVGSFSKKSSESVCSSNNSMLYCKAEQLAVTCASMETESSLNPCVKNSCSQSIPKSNYILYHSNNTPFPAPNCKPVRTIPHINAGSPILKTIPFSNNVGHQTADISSSQFVNSVGEQPVLKTMLEVPSSNLNSGIIKTSSCLNSPIINVFPNNKVNVQNTQTTALNLHKKSQEAIRSPPLIPLKGSPYLTVAGEQSTEIFGKSIPSCQPFTKPLPKSIICSDDSSALFHNFKSNISQPKNPVDKDNTSDNGNTEKINCLPKSSSSKTVLTSELKYSSASEQLKEIVTKFVHRSSANEGLLQSPLKQTSRTSLTSTPRTVFTVVQSPYSHNNLLTTEQGI